MDNANPIIECLRQHADELRQQFDVASLEVFGSASRGQFGPDSDVDVLVEFQHPATLSGYTRLKGHLEQLLNRPVDLVTAAGLKPRLRENISKDLLRVA